MYLYLLTYSDKLREQTIEVHPYTKTRDPIQKPYKTTELQKPKTDKLQLRCFKLKYNKPYFTYIIVCTYLSTYFIYIINTYPQGFF